MSVAVVLVAAGSGQRLGAAVPKAFVELQGCSLLRWSCDQVLKTPGVRHLIIVAPDAWLDVARDTADDAVADSAEPRSRGRRTQHHRPDACRVDVVAGGADRRASVAAGLTMLQDDDDVVLVHDAARALAPPSLFERVIDAVRAGADAVVPGLPVIDTVKVVDAHGRVTATPDRVSLRAVQTPQGFGRDALLRAHADNADAVVTDDAGLVELIGTPTLVVDGDVWAAKITTREDLDHARRRLEEEQ
ncbi:MAG: 2-C-methyl-D-erythritol 4-phosphate cytidylyltransferase [Mobilicoccus sp.]|nr:2-C-methyl-D-erythritol 4-phosphate cytidylyltransferase [Mobilicoccus sp.]